MRTTIVYLPITVPDGKYCFGVDEDDVYVCEHFDNEGGHERCMVGFHLPHQCRDAQGNVLKPAECLNLARPSLDP